MSWKETNWFKNVLVAAISVFATVILLTVLVLFRLDNELWQAYGWIDSVRWIFSSMYEEGHIHRIATGAAVVILIAVLVRMIVEILPHYSKSVVDREAELEKQKQKLARKKQELDGQGRELEQKREKYVNQMKAVEIKCKKLEKRVGGLRGRIKQAVDLLKEEQPKIGQVRSLLLRAYKAKGENIEATDSELGRLRAENELLYTEKAQLQENKVQMKRDMEELKEDVQDLQRDKEQLQKNLEKYIEPEKAGRRGGGRKKK